MSVPSVNRTIMTAQAGHWWSGVGPMDVSQARPYLPPTTGPTAGDGTSVHHGTAEQTHRSRNRDRAAGRVRSRDRMASATGSIRSTRMVGERGSPCCPCVAGARHVAVSPSVPTDFYVALHEALDLPPEAARGAPGAFEQLLGPLGGLLKCQERRRPRPGKGAEAARSQGGVGF